jgi:hypothetical protein
VITILDIRKQHSIIILLAVFTFTACAGQRNRMIIRPDPEQIRLEQVNLLEQWQITKSQNGEGETGIPPWVYLYLTGETGGITSMEQREGKFLFIGENRGGSFNALERWVNGFNVLLDVPRLVSARVERRLVSAASLFPDDEYGEYFATLVKKVADGEYPGAVKETSFWVRMERLPAGQEEEDEDDLPQTDALVTEMYVFLILTSIDSETFRGQLRPMMTGIRTAVPPTREQLAAINRVQQTFFEGF